MTDGCCCAGNPQDYEGPLRICPVHGATEQQNARLKVLRQAFSKYDAMPDDALCVSAWGTETHGAFYARLAVLVAAQAQQQMSRAVVDIAELDDVYLLRLAHAPAMLEVEKRAAAGLEAAGYTLRCLIHRSPAGRFVPGITLVVEKKVEEG